MTELNQSRSPPRLSARLAAGLAISALLVLGSGIGPVQADDRGEHRGWGHERHENGNWSGGYYPAPPVVYQGYYAPPAPSYYYAPPPPVYYGPSVGITVPGINLNFR
jgi:hypothetical protein